MYYFKNNMTSEEFSLIKSITEYNDLHVKLLYEFSGECYKLLWKRKEGDIYYSYIDIYSPSDLFKYHQCFDDSCNFYSQDRFEFLKCTPLQIIYFYDYYIVKISEFPDEWHRGEIKKMEIYFWILAQIV